MNTEDTTTIYADYGTDGRPTQITITMPNATVSAINAIVQMLGQAQRPLSPQDVDNLDRSLARTKVIVQNPATTERLPVDPLNTNVPWQNFAEQTNAR